jgi:Mg-chelatase subunit ChlI
MKVLKTIVATAVVVFAMTTVAMAGVQQLTRAQDAQAVDQTRAQHTVTLTDKQLARLIDHQTRSHVREAQRTKTHARHVDREHAQAQQGAHEAEAQHTARVQKSTQSGSASPSASHHYEASQQTHVSSGGHDGGHAGGHGSD